MGTIPQTPEEYRAWWQEQRPDIPYGYCWCGCGQRTSPARQRDKRLNYFKGEPSRFVRGHAHTKPRVDASNYAVADMGHTTPCWLWNRVRFYETGYGMLYERGTGLPKGAHRIFYEYYKGQIPLGFEIDHLCRVPACVNPDHLEAVTKAVNQQRGNAAKITRDIVEQIRVLYAAGNYTHRQLGDRFGVSRSRIGHIVRGETWK